MKKVVVIGAGLSAQYLIEYMEEKAPAHHWVLWVADRSIDLIRSKCKKAETIQIQLDIENEAQLDQLLKDASLVISMLPAFLHIRIAEKCLQKGIHMATASYLNDDIRAMNRDVKSRDLIFLNECGLDPGIDHLSAMKLIEDIRGQGAEILKFESFAGGLIAPECEDNPWRYKFTWNPRNVVLAGQGGAVKFIQNGQYKYIPYHKLFRRTEIVNIEDYGKFEAYANRDSLTYRETYGLDKVKTMYRGTLRRSGFSRAWNCFVELGATDDSYIIENSEHMTYRDFINTFLAYHPTDSVELKLRQYLKIDQDDIELWERLLSLDILSLKKIGLKKATPAQILQHILEQKWSLNENDRDMILLWHKLIYLKAGKKYRCESSLVSEGENRHKTAMAKTVGLPLAIAAKLILLDQIEERGCILPVYPSFYLPILDELREYDIRFKEKITEI